MQVTARQRTNTAIVWHCRCSTETLNHAAVDVLFSQRYAFVIYGVAPLALLHADGVQHLRGEPQPRSLSTKKEFDGAWRMTSFRYETTTWIIVAFVRGPRALPCREIQVVVLFKLKIKDDAVGREAITTLHSQTFLTGNIR